MRKRQQPFRKTGQDENKDMPLVPPPDWHTEIGPYAMLTSLCAVSVHVP